MRQALLEIMQGLVEIQDLKEFLRFIHQTIAKVIYAENFFVIQYDAETALFEEIYSVDKYDPPALPSNLENSISAYVFRSGHPLLLTQARFDELDAQGAVKLIGTNSPFWLGVPIRTSFGIIGVIEVQDYDYPNRYSERDINFLEAIASQVGQAISRKQADAALKESEEKYRGLVQGLSEAISIYIEGKIVFANAACAQLMRASSVDDLRGKPVIEFVHPDYRNFVIQRMIAAQKERKPLTVATEKFIRMDGSAVDVEVNASPTTFERKPAVQLIIRDITEHKQAETALREIQELLTLFLRNSPYYTYIKVVTSSESRIQLASDNFQEMIGIAGQDMVGKTMDELYLAEFAAKISADDWSVVSKGEALTLDEDFNDRHYNTIKFPIIQGEKILLAGYTIDITERKRAEVALRDEEN